MAVPSKESRLDDRAILDLGQLPRPARDLLDRATAHALALGAAPFLVGGSVRDLLLGRATIDLDLVVVGDAIAVAWSLGAALGDAGTTLRVHGAFGTATVIPAAGPPLDLITARREVYPRPGALPVVTPGTLDDDLRRRDFTINALALALDPAERGRFHDPLGGRADLAAGIVRTLHPASFWDDPTRLLRATRYAGRLGFALAAETAAQFRAAVAADPFATLAMQRLTHEFVRLLDEDRTALMLDWLAESGALAGLAPALCWGAAERAAFDRLDDLSRSALSREGLPLDASRWELRLALLVAALRPGEARAAAEGLALPGRVVALAEGTAALVADLARAPLPTADSALGRRLDGYGVAPIAAAAAYTPDGETRDALLRYLLSVRELRPVLDGDALRALGVPPGPVYRPALAALRDRKRDDPGLSIEGERAFLISWLAARS